MVGFPPDNLLDDRLRGCEFGQFTNFNKDCTKEFIHTVVQELQGWEEMRMKIHEVYLPSLS